MRKTRIIFKARIKEKKDLRGRKLRKLVIKIEKEKKNRSKVKTC